MRLNTKAESDAATVVGKGATAETGVVDIAEDAAITVIRRAKPPVARHDKCLTAHNLCIKNRLTIPEWFL